MNKIWQFLARYPVLTPALLVLMLTCQLTYGQNLVANTSTQDASAVLDSSHPYYRYIENIDKYYTGGTISIHFKPIARSLREVTQGTADFHFLYPCDNHNGLPFKVSSTEISRGIVGLYSSTKNPLTLEQLQHAPLQLNEKELSSLNLKQTEAQTVKLLRTKGTFDAKNNYLQNIEQILERQLSAQEKEALIRASYPYQIETGRITKSPTEIPVQPSNNMNSSIHKLLANRIDGLIHFVVLIEKVATEEHLDDKLARALYGYWGLCFTVAKNSHGERVDREVSAAIRAYQASPDYDAFETIRRTEQEWLDRYDPQKNQ